MSNENQVKAEAKPKTEVTQVKMSDGRTIGFAGKRKLIKDVLDDGVRFDFRNGETRTFKIPEDLMLRLAIHGAAQKIGDETAGEEDVDDMVVAVDAMIERLGKGEWGATRAAGDGFSGASVVIRAICEATGKNVDAVKAFLQGKLDAAKAAGQSLTRQALYASFRQSSTVGPIIERLEKDKAKKSASVNADELLGELA